MNRKTIDARYRVRSWEKEMTKKAKYRARRDGLAFDLTTDYVKALWPADGACPVLGTPLTRRHRENAPTLDRIVPALGYVRGNVAIISARANAIKNDGTPREHRAVADWTERMVATCNH